MRKKFEPLIVADADAVELAGMLVVFIDQHIFGLGRANLVIINLLKLVLGRHLFACGRRGIAVVVKAFVAVPRGAGEFHPLEMIAKRLFRRDIQNVDIVPVRAAFRDAVADVFSGV